MARHLNYAQAQTVKQIDRIGSTLAALLQCLEQEKSDLGCAGHARASELAHIAERLEQVEDFWTQSGPEYEE
jgi:hypothetical protein